VLDVVDLRVKIGTRDDAANDRIICATEPGHRDMNPRLQQIVSLSIARAKKVASVGDVEVHVENISIGWGVMDYLNSR